MSNSSKIVVLYGGTSAEREVSISTAAALCEALDELSVPYTKVDAIAGWEEQLEALRPGFVLNALHGGEGENGTVQTILDDLALPYQGSGAKASMLAMDKPLAKRLFAAAGLDVAKEAVFEPSTLPKWADVALAFAGAKVVVKPADEGSSVGIYMVENEAEWRFACAGVQRHGRTVMLEEFIPGREFTVAVLDGKALGLLEILPKKGAFYDYESKYTTGGSVHVDPADLPDSLRARLHAEAETAHQALGCTGVTRVDFRYTEEAGRLVILEINTLPGMTATSLVPEIAQNAGISFTELVKRFLPQQIKK